MALLVRCTKQLLASRENGSDESLRYPSLKKWREKSQFRNTHTLISNFLPSISIGFQMYFWITKEQALSTNSQLQGFLSLDQLEREGRVLMFPKDYFLFFRFQEPWGFLPARFKQFKRKVSKSSRLSNISIPLPLFRPVGLRSQRQLSPLMYSDFMSGRDKGLSFFLSSGWGLKQGLSFQMKLFTLWQEFPLWGERQEGVDSLCFVEFRIKKFRSCLRLNSQYSSSKSITKVMGVIENNSIFLVQVYRCRFLISPFLVVIQLWNQNWFKALLIRAVDLPFSNTTWSQSPASHRKLGTPSPFFIYFQCFLVERTLRISSQLFLEERTMQVRCLQEEGLSSVTAVMALGKD